MLIVVEDRDVEFRLESLLDLEAGGRRDVLQVDPAHGRLEHAAEGDHILGIGRVDLEVEDIDPGELLEEHPLPLHDRLGRRGADITEAEHGGAVRDHRHEVSTGGVAEDIVGIRVNLAARLGDAGGVREREIARRRHRLRRHRLHLARAGVLVVRQRVLTVVGHVGSGSGGSFGSMQGRVG